MITKESFIVFNKGKLYEKFRRALEQDWFSNEG